jgi:hypothetical protein
MAIFRKIHTSFWSDPFIQDLDNDHKLFYLYLLTNEKTKQCGIYEISKKQISFELGYSIDRVSKLLTYFVKTGKIMYSEETKEIAIKNWNKFNGSTSPLVVKCIKSELCNVKNRVLIEYVNGIHTPLQEEEEQEQEQKEEQEQDTEKETGVSVNPFSIEEIFEQCWKAYQGASDRQVGSKQDALKKFKILEKEDLEKIRVHLPKYILNHQRTKHTEYFPNFTVYLNQRKFEDEKMPYADKVAEFENNLNNWYKE